MAPPGGGKYRLRGEPHYTAVRRGHQAMATVIYPRYTIPERIIVGALTIITWPFKWMIKACLEKLCEHDEDCFV
jgi:hypothetical protein